MQHRATIAEVARRAGVSPTTVSHALSGRRHVAPATRRCIEQAARDLRYRPNAVARSLRTRRSLTASLIIPDISNPFYPRLARGLQDTLAAAGYHTLVCNTDRIAANELEYVVDVVNRQVDGVVVVAFHLTTDDLREVPLADVPFVSVGPRLDHAAIDVVSSGDASGARDATRHLLTRGHTVGMIGGPAGLPPSEIRAEGYRQALAEAGVELRSDWIATGDFTHEGGVIAARELLEQADRPSAIFCANDLMAIGAMSVARELRLRIPEDIALVGYDDIDAAALVSPGLTTVLNPADEVGVTAGRLLLERMQGYEGPRRNLAVKHPLVVRQSS
ncbi:MAG: LacI family DNA-binding transcriptional regulator [Gaiellales bacterium]